MRAIVVMFDSLNRLSLPPYGASGVRAPNFERLARRSVTFERSYTGSLPCMPARRDLHTGKLNFLHRSWGPLEPWDVSFPEVLKGEGVYTHLATDHQHYFEDGGGNYHTRYNTWEFIRGQEGDPWKGHVRFEAPPSLNRGPTAAVARQDWVNRLYTTAEEAHPQVRTFDAGLEFIETNAGDDRWFLQIETFDPHEPFFAPDRFTEQYPDDYDGPLFDWPAYGRVAESEQAVAHATNRYRALLSLCDESLGRVLDAMDEHDMWGDTMLVVCTDHGFLLGEHGWWAKTVPPWYEETSHTPLFIWDPRSSREDERRSSIVQLIDIAPTVLEYFGVPVPPEVDGQSLARTIATDEPVRDAALFGSFGGHVNVTDGRHVYLRACATPDNAPLYEHTLMPAHMRSRFSVEELAQAELVTVPGIPLPVLRTPGHALSPYYFGTALYYLENDPTQASPVVDDETEARMLKLLVDLMVEVGAPDSQFARLGLPTNAARIADAHLSAGESLGRVLDSEWTMPSRDELPTGALSVDTELGVLLAMPAAAEILRRLAPALVGTELLGVPMRLSIFELARTAGSTITEQSLRSIALELRRIEGATW